MIAPLTRLEAARREAERLSPAETMLRAAAERCGRLGHLRDGAMACAPCLAWLLTDALAEAAESRRSEQLLELERLERERPDRQRAMNFRLENIE